MIHLLREPLFCASLAALWLLPCPLQDYRTRRASNWLSVPFFLLAWPFAFLTGHLTLTFAVFVGVYVASQVEPRFGGADAKLMVGQVALAPLGLGIAVEHLAQPGHRYLVVLDDLWSEEPLALLPEVASPHALLVTTRDRQLAAAWPDSQPVFVPPYVAR